MADQDQGNDQLVKPCLGHRDIEKHVRCFASGGKRLVQRGFCCVLLTVDELPADTLSLGGMGNRFAPRQGMNGV